MAEVAFDRAPRLGSVFTRAVLARKPGLAEGATIPRIAITLAGAAADPARVAAYRRVCGFAGAGTLPVTYPHILAFPLHLALFTNPEFPLPVLGLIHLRNAIVLRRPIALDTRLDLACHVEGHRDVENGIEFDVVTRASDAGEQVWEEWSTILRKRRSPRGERGAPPAPPPPGDDPGRTRSVVWRLREDAGRRYAQVSGDYNPIHLRAATAKLFGFPRAIVHGMWSLARCLAEVADDAPAPPLRAEVEFKRAVLLPSEALFSSGPEGRGHAFSLKSRDGKPHLIGRIGPA